MEEYKKMYLLLFNAITDALEQMEKQNYGSAKETLITAQQKTAKQCRPVPPQMLPRISTISPIGGERSNAADAQAVRRRASVTRAPRSRARLIPVTISRRPVAKPRTPHQHCAARAVLQA